MRILVISNLYPPYYIGGYELACKDIVDKLETMGHDIYVLTSTYGVDRPVVEGNIYRQLYFYNFSDSHALKNELKFFLREYKNRNLLIKYLRELKPELIYIWNMERLCWCLLGILQNINIPKAYAIFDIWLLRSIETYERWVKYWNRKPSNALKIWIKQRIKNYLDNLIPDYSNMKLSYSHFFGRFLEKKYVEANLIPKSLSKVIYYGISQDYFNQNKTIRQENTIKLLYAGQVMRHKGVHTAINALSVLVKRGYNLNLTIVGPMPVSNYVLYLKTLIKQNNLDSYVTFLGQLPREELFSVYYNHDVLLFPSTIVEEPFGITLIEAMACGLPVVATATGGSVEILRSEENCLLFPPENAVTLADQIERLIKEPNLRQELKSGGLRTVKRNFAFDKTIEEIEKYLKSCLRKSNMNKIYL